jgi:hypothetical protein
VWKISPPPGFDPWTAQPVASGYTGYAILAHYNGKGMEKTKGNHDQL